MKTLIPEVIRKMEIILFTQLSFLSWLFLSFPDIVCQALLSLLFIELNWLIWKCLLSFIIFYNLYRHRNKFEYVSIDKKEELKETTDNINIIKQKIIDYVQKNQNLPQHIARDFGLNIPKHSKLIWILKQHWFIEKWKNNKTIITATQDELNSILSYWWIYDINGEEYKPSEELDLSII